MRIDLVAQHRVLRLECRRYCRGGPQLLRMELADQEERGIDSCPGRVEPKEIDGIATASKCRFRQCRSFLPPEDFHEEGGEARQDGGNDDEDQAPHEPPPAPG